MLCRSHAFASGKGWQPLIRAISHRDLKNSVQAIGCFLIVVAAVVLSLWLPTYYSFAPGAWRFIAEPPIPTGSRQHTVSYPSNDVERDVSFVTDQSGADIQAFYRAKLPRLGWHYRYSCPIDPACSPTAVSDPTEVIEVYARGGTDQAPWPTLEVFIEQPGSRATAGTSRTVWIREFK